MCTSATVVANTVSKKGMLIRSLTFVLSTLPLWAQHPYSKEAQNAAIKRVKTVDVSSLDRGLPKVTLEFFLKYEGEGAPIKWRVSNCYQPNGNPSIDRERDSPMCVEADIDLKGDRSAAVVVSVGTLKTGPVGVPTVFSVTVTDPIGLVRSVRHLSDLPMELHRSLRPLPKSPRDLPLPVDAALSPLAAGNSQHLMIVVISSFNSKSPAQAKGAGIRPF